MKDVDEISLLLITQIQGILSNETMPPPQRKARCQVLLNDALTTAYRSGYFEEHEEIPDTLEGLVSFNSMGKHNHGMR